MARMALSLRMGVALGAALALLHASPVRADYFDMVRDSIMGTDFTRDRVDLAALRRANARDLPLIRGVVFGRHGRIFRNDDIQVWLTTNGWYHPDPTFRNDELNDTERANLDLIRQVEAEKHEFIQPGDLRWWQARPMTAGALGSHSSAEWSVLRAEVEAIHGRRFDGEPWLQHYFEERYWYRSNPDYDARSLGDIERQNLALIDSLSRARGAGAVSPCELGYYEERPLSKAQLLGASFTTLRILRNEVYARHGMTFRDLELSDWFVGRGWYTPRDSGVVALSPMEQRNVATIAAYERALHDSLHTAPLDTTRLMGMFAEDARRLRLEIYARHGRVFRRKWEQDYVASLPGYHPDPGYSDSRLSDVERANIAAIVAYEKTAASVMDAVEG